MPEKKPATRRTPAKKAATKRTPVKKSVAKTKPRTRLPVGRPTAYHKDLCEKVFKLCLLGATDAEMSEIIGVSEVTFNDWKNKYPEFLKSIKAGKTDADADVAKSLYQRACGYSHKDTHVSNFQGAITLTEIEKHYPPDTGAAFIWLKNRQSGRWKDKTEQEVTHSGSINMSEVDKELADAAKERERKIKEMEEAGIAGKFSTGGKS